MVIVIFYQFYNNVLLHVLFDIIISWHNEHYDYGEKSESIPNRNNKVNINEMLSVT